MSSHPGATKTRVVADFYETPSWVVKPLLDELVQFMPPMETVDVLDPGMGAGALGLTIRQHPSWGTCRLSGCELPEEASKHPDLSNTYDSLDLRSFLETPGFWMPKAYDLVVCNPPFSLAMDFIERGSSMLKPGGVGAFLVNMHALGSADRANRWALLRSRILGMRMLAPRPSFRTDGGTDSTEYCWILTGSRLLQRHPRLLHFGWYIRPDKVAPILPSVAKSERPRDERPKVVAG